MTGTIRLVLGIVLAVAAGMMITLGAVALFGPPTAAGAAGPPQYTEEAAVAGINHVYDGDWTFFVGGGVAAFDCDADGREDLYFAGGSKPAALYRNQSPIGGALRFSIVPDAATDLVDVSGAYPIDIDGDRVTDLAVLRLGEDVLLRGLGNCRFERANEAWGFDGGDAWTVAFSAKWEGAAAMPTLAFGNYVALTDDREAAEGCADNVMLRPEPTSDGYAAPIALAPGWCTLSILFSDWDRSGRRDLRMTNDRHYYRDGEEQLWRVADDEPPRLYARDEGWARMQVWGMGIASYDLTGDGLPEVFLTSQGDNKLQTLADGAEQPRYRDIAIRRGVTAHRPFAGGDVAPSTAWHAEFDDVNNDGFVDLFIAKGNVEAMVEFADRDPSNLLLGQPDGSFVEGAEEAGLLSYARARGGALADFNLDGMLDLVVVNRRENVKLWRSVGAGSASDPAAMGNWVSLRLEQAGANADAIGSWIEVRTDDDRTMEREVTIGGGHAGGQVGWIHFGLGEATGVEVRVQWPDGTTGPWQVLALNQLATVEREAGEVIPWSPPQEPP